MTTLVQIQVESKFQTRLQKCADLHHADFGATPKDITQDTGTMQVMARRVMEGAAEAPSCLVGSCLMLPEPFLIPTPLGKVEVVSKLPGREPESSHPEPPSSCWVPRTCPAPSLTVPSQLPRLKRPESQLFIMVTWGQGGC